MSTYLLVHNYYQQRGGEDAIFEAEADLLEAHGHRVLRYTLHNDRIDAMSNVKRLAATLWNHRVYRELRAFIRDMRPEVAHFHNTFPLVSPAAYYAAQAEGVPVIQTLNNYRLACPGAYLLRDGKVCEDCIGKAIPFSAIRHGCYRDSPLATAAVVAMLAAHRALSTWDRQIDLYALYMTDFSVDTFVRAGLPAEKLFVKPNFVDPDPGPGAGAGGYALFVGRLSPEKGIRVLVEAWGQVGTRLPLKIVGDGPLAPLAADAAARIPGVEWLGRRPPEAVYALMQDAACLVFPSEWYEGLPRTIVESFATGTPVVASDLGAMSRLVVHGENGLHFAPGDAEGLARQVLALAAEPARLAVLRRGARASFEAHYTAERSYALLMEMYARVRRPGATGAGGETAIKNTSHPDIAAPSPVPLETA